MITHNLQIHAVKNCCSEDKTYIPIISNSEISIRLYLPWRPFVQGREDTVVIVLAGH